MAKNNNLTDFLKSIADTIRAKCGVTGKINPQDFTNYIGNGGGSGGLSTDTTSLNISVYGDFTEFEVHYLAYVGGQYRYTKEYAIDGIGITNVVLNSPIYIRGLDIINEFYVDPDEEQSSGIQVLDMLIEDNEDSSGYVAETEVVAVYLTSTEPQTLKLRNM